MMPVPPSCATGNSQSCKVFPHRCSWNNVTQRYVIEARGRSIPHLPQALGEHDEPTESESQSAAEPARRPTAAGWPAAEARPAAAAESEARPGRPARRRPTGRPAGPEELRFAEGK